MSLEDFVRIFQIVNWVRTFQTKAQAEQRPEFSERTGLWGHTESDTTEVT